MNKENRIPPGYKYASCLCPDGQKREFIVPDSFNETDPVLEQGSIKGICGYADEHDAWELLLSIGSALLSLNKVGMTHACISTDHVYLWRNNMMLLEGGNLLLAEGSEYPSKEIEPAFMSPQQASLGKISIPDRNDIRFNIPLGSLGSAISHNFPSEPISSDALRTYMTIQQDSIWSLGATVFHLLMGVKIFNGQGGKVQREDTPVPSFNESRYGTTLCNLVKACLSYNPESRPSLEQIIAISEEELMKSPAKMSEKRKKGNGNAASLDAVTYWPEKIDA